MSTTIDTSVESGIRTIDQAAAYLSIPKATLYTWRTRRAGFGPRAVKLDGCSATRVLTWTRGSPSTSRASTTPLPSRSSGRAPAFRCPGRADRAKAGSRAMGRGRPPTSLGTWGSIRTTQVREGAYRARTRIRDKDGVTREVTATGTTVAAAERALREKLVDRATPTQQSITADTSMAKLAALWLAYLRDEGTIEATTIQ